MGCIYIATCKVNGKQYIGQTSATMAYRRKQHIKLAKYPKKGSFGVFQRAIAKHGADNFEWEVLCEAENQELDELEALAIEMNMTLLPNGYNMCVGGGSAFKVCAGRRRNAADSHLPKYIWRAKDGYQVQHLPSGQNAMFATNHHTNEENLERAKQWLQEVLAGKQMAKRKGGAGKTNCKREQDRALPTYIQSLWKGDKCVGYICSMKKIHTHRRFCSLGKSLDENLTDAKTFRAQMMGQIL